MLERICRADFNVATRYSRFRCDELGEAFEINLTPISKYTPVGK
ncbi:MAG: hypothetical protein ACI8UR_002241 [Natronomonas sp.]|jgi:hypothetical protein